MVSPCLLLAILMLILLSSPVWLRVLLLVGLLIWPWLTRLGRARSLMQLAGSSWMKARLLLLVPMRWSGCLRGPGVVHPLWAPAAFPEALDPLDSPLFAWSLQVGFRRPRFEGVWACVVGRVGCVEIWGPDLISGCVLILSPFHPSLSSKIRKPRLFASWLNLILLMLSFCEACMPYFCRSGHPVVTVDQFLDFVDPFFPQEPVQDLPTVTGQDLFEVAEAKTSLLLGAWMDGLGTKSRHCSLPGWLFGLATELLDAYIAMIPKTDGLGSASLVCAVGYLKVVDFTQVNPFEGVGGRLGPTVCLWPWERCLVGGGLVLCCSGYLGGTVLVLVMISCMSWLLKLCSPLIRLIGPFLTVLLVGWGRLPGSGKFTSLFPLRSSLRLVLGTWCRDGGIPQGCLLSMFLLLLYMSLGVSVLRPCPRLVLNSMRTTSSVAQCVPQALFGAARFTVQYVRAVGQDVSLGKCVLLSTSKASRQSTKLWDDSGDGRRWSVRLDVRDLGRHLDFTGRAELVLFLGSRMLPMRLLGFRLSWVWSEVSICQLGCMLLMRLMCLPPLSVPFVLLL